MSAGGTPVQILSNKCWKVLMSHKLSRIFLQELFDKRITSGLIERSRSWTTRPFPVMSTEFVGRCLGVTEFSSNAPFCVSFSM